MAERRNPHQVSADEAARILGECDRVARKASTSSERAAKASQAAQQEVALSNQVVATYEEAQANFD